LFYQSHYQLVNAWITSPNPNPNIRSAPAYRTAWNPSPKAAPASSSQMGENMDDDADEGIKVEEQVANDFDEEIKDDFD
jgi:hypothetical protein